ncbi:MAG: class I SAM-dependent methyltransferase, partial [Bacteroidota bacterium]
ESKPKQEGYYYTDKKVLKAKFEGKSTEAVFEKIHQENFWENSDSVSGPGSGLEQTATIRSALPELWKRYDIRSILDIPCGDFFWMKEMDLSNITYTGGDIVSKIIEKNKQEYEREGISFRKMNLILSELPKVDLVLCRDCLVHFSFADIGEAIANLKKSQSTWLLTTHFEENRRNNDIITGDWRPLNLCNRPFHFPEPEAIINEQCTELDGSYSDKSLALWRIADL